MANSIQKAVSDGTLVSLDIAIAYIDKGDITFFVNDVVAAPTYTIVWTTDTQISITPAVPLGEEITVKRITPSLQPYHKFGVGGAVFSDLSLDENFRQILFIAQEAIDGGGVTDFYSDMNMHGYRIKASADGIEPTDLVTVRQYQADALGSYANRVAVEAIKTSVDASEIVCTNAAASATASEIAAAASASTATTMANSASVDAGVANTAATNAANSYDSFDDRYLGAKASAPTLDNDGNPLLVGALYWNTGGSVMYVWSGSAWLQAYSPASTGDVLGPASSTDNQLVLFDATTGKLLKGGVVVTAAGQALLDDVDTTAQKTTLSLQNVDNTSDANKPVSTAQYAAIALKAPVLDPVFTGKQTLPALLIPWGQEKIQALGNTGAATLTPLISVGAYITATSTGITTWTFNLAGLTTNYVTSFTLTLTNGGAFAQTWTGVKWAGGTAPTLTAAGIDVIVFTYDGTILRGFLSAKDVK